MDNRIYEFKKSQEKAFQELTELEMILCSGEITDENDKINIHLALKALYEEFSHLGTIIRRECING